MPSLFIKIPVTGIISKVQKWRPIVCVRETILFLLSTTHKFDVPSGLVLELKFSILSMPAIKSHVTYFLGKNDTLLFGRESAGVPKAVHKKIKNKIKIPMIEKKRSLNLATSVAIALSENLRQTNYIWTK